MTRLGGSAAAAGHRRGPAGRNCSRSPRTSAVAASASEEGSSSNQWNEAAARLNHFPVPWDLHSCRNEYFIGAHIYTRSWILAPALSTLSAITTEPFLSFR